MKKRKFLELTEQDINLFKKNNIEYFLNKNKNLNLNKRNIYDFYYFLEKNLNPDLYQFFIKNYLYIDYFYYFQQDIYKIIKNSNYCIDSAHIDSNLFLELILDDNFKLDKTIDNGSIYTANKYNTADYIYLFLDINILNLNGEQINILTNHIINKNINLSLDSFEYINQKEEFKESYENIFIYLCQIYSQEKPKLNAILKKILFNIDVNLNFFEKLSNINYNLENIMNFYILAKTESGSYTFDKNYDKFKTYIEKQKINDNLSLINDNKEKTTIYKI